MEQRANLDMLEVASMLSPRVVERSLAFRTVVFLQERFGQQSQKTREAVNKAKTTYQDRDCPPNARDLWSFFFCGGLE